MPYYLFSHPETEETKLVHFGMNDEKVYIDEKGVKWNREWTKPLASIDTKLDPNSATEFDRKFSNKHHTVGDLWDASKELSEKRKKTQGKDPIKQKFVENYAKTRKGRKPLGYKE